MSQLKYEMPEPVHARPGCLTVYAVLHGLAGILGILVILN